MIEKTDRLSIGYYATEIVDIHNTPSFKADDYVGRRAYFETYDGALVEGTLEKGTSRAHSELIIRVSPNGFARVGSVIYLADEVA